MKVHGVVIANDGFELTVQMNDGNTVYFNRDSESEQEFLANFPIGSNVEAFRFDTRIYG